MEVSWSAAGDSGVLVSLAAPDAAESLTADPGTQSATVSFSVLSAEVRSKLGVNGLAFELSRVDAAGAATVTLRIPSSLVEGLYGADYASRVAWQVLSSTAKGKKGSAAEAAAITGAEVVS